MKTAIIALTRNGTQTALRLAPKLDAAVYVKEEFSGVMDCLNKDVIYFEGPLHIVAGKIFNQYEALVFIMACGIVVRTLAPLIKSKTSDPAVLVMDEKGKHVISLLSGHIGGANKLAARVAEIVGGTPVITTSTDVNEVISFDVFATENNCVIENISNLKYISSDLVNGRKVGLFTDCKIKGKIPENIILISNLSDEKINEVKSIVVFSDVLNLIKITDKNLINEAGFNSLNNELHFNENEKKILFIRPRNLIIGIGCKRGTTKEDIKSALFDLLEKSNRSIHSIKCICTIDLKKDEAGLIELRDELNLNLEIFRPDEIVKVQSHFEGSEFVKKIASVSCVAEPCALLGATKGEMNGRIICKKTIYKGITLAIAKEEHEYTL
ncbi:MAG: cobalt-precorrin 5A hydrolase [Bacillota bacterium]|nr:cobalt-precorrin 5A hydrolase [Bacillota bacterium]